MEKRSEPAAIKGTAEGKTSWVVFHQFRNQGENILSETFRRNKKNNKKTVPCCKWLTLFRKKNSEGEAQILPAGGSHKHAKDIRPLKQDNNIMEKSIFINK